MAIRCKFQCVTKEPAWESSTDHFRIVLEARYDTTIPEDQKFSKYTPTGKLETVISNPAALAQIEVGKSYYIDMIPADSAAT